MISYSFLVKKYWASFVSGQGDNFLEKQSDIQQMCRRESEMILRQTSLLATSVSQIPVSDVLI